jgi:hypothetical protein
MTLYGCVTGSRYTMNASLFSEALGQDPDSGEFQRGYVFEGRIKCYAAGIAASGKDTPGTFESYTSQGIYSASDLVRIYTADPIPKAFKVSSIQDAKGVMWREDDDEPTIFDSNGSVPIVNAKGRIVEYVTMLTRSEVQDGSIF